MVNSALIVSGAEKSADYLRESLSRNRFGEIAVARSCGAARLALTERTFDLCVVNAPLPDEYGDAFSREAAAKPLTQTILIVRNELLDAVSAKMDGLGVFIVSKPLGPGILSGALRLASAAHSKVNAVLDENRRLLRKIEDIRIVDRAKCILIQYLMITEAEAHRYIERRAMDMRAPKRDVARDIIKTYEN